jgi:hypothetical protein
MAGSFKHLVNDENKYIGFDLVENMGDAKEAMEQMVFMILRLTEGWEQDRRINDVTEYYYACMRGEREWPNYMRPGIEPV